MDSALTPKIRRPAAITGNDGELAVTTAPTKQMRAKILYLDGSHAQ
jgi:hypothetical protein